MNTGTCQLCGKIGHLTEANTCQKCTNLTGLEEEYLKMEAEDKEIQNRIARELDEEGK